MGNDWAKEFREKLEDWRQPAPEGVWEAVSSEMSVGKGRGSVLKVLGWAGGAIAAAAAVAAIVFLGFGRGQSDGSGVSVIRDSGGEALAQVIAGDEDFVEKGEGAVEAEFAEQPLHLERADETLAMADKALRMADGALSVEDRAMEIADGVVGTGESALEDKGNDGVSEDGDAGEDSIGERRDEGGEERVATAEENRGEGMAEDGWKEIDGVRTARRGNVRLGAVISGGSGGNSHLDGYAGTGGQTGMVFAFGVNPQADIMLFNRTREVSTDTKYFQPVKVGVSVKWNFAGRWGLESGLYWSGLYSRTTSGSDNYFTRTRQELHYIGIPLDLTCDIWSRKGFTVYATAGGMMEKCVGGRLRTEYIYNNASAAPESSAVSEKELQWSACVNVGAEYLFSKRIGLYLEPGAVWHFNNGSATDNVYKARPFDFNLSLGLRFAF
ncbi:MAG: outer membrane beta-barrel protein [Candidatus Cryptobacteroides sp.]